MSSKKKRIYDRYGGRCAICEMELTLDKDRCYDNDYMQIDHILPLHLGGSNEEKNLRPLCKSCNSRRKGTTGDEFVSVCEKELIEFINLRVDRTMFYVDSARFGILTKEHLDTIELLIRERRRLEDEFLKKIRAAIPK